ncbi:acyl-[ACP]--phospholipid O-acyltransferase [Motiliproteus sediminis]|uniref:acyl-[ACP]--phospholipid O-acyltransferase n=1 Tax=Motiliproteus sediminis TaxID=1468178 RepID=UPI001AEF8DA4|nr:acyl-[ACP]--phospholipid O-acyltransferase [Motiliproteus sediminis]
MRELIRLAGFVPFILMVFLNAFVDLGHKIVVQNTVFKIYDGQEQILLTALVNALILIPFIALLSPAGYLSDRFAKPKVMRAAAALAVVLTTLITLCYYQGWFQTAFAMTLLLAVQSAIYSPAKFGYLREWAGKTLLASANGLVQAVSIVAILSGIFAFSILFEGALGGVTYRNEADILRAIAPLGWALVGCSLLELLLAFRIAPVEEPQAAEPFTRTDYLRGTYLKRNLAALVGNRAIWLSIIGLSIFWGISQVMLASFPAYAKEQLAITNTVVIQGLLACSGIGIMLGSLAAGRASRNHIETGLVPLGALGVVLSLWLLPMAGSASLIAFCFIGVGFFGGLFIVPLNSLIQYHAPEAQLGRILAGNNWIQNIVMLGFLGCTLLFAHWGLSSFGLMQLLILVAIAGAFYTVYQLPHSLVRLVVAKLFAGRYRVEVLGFKNLPPSGAVLLLGNHISWLDWALIQIACPRPVRFVMHRGIYNRWYWRWLLDLFGVIPIAGGQSKQALETVNQLLKNGEVVCLFPEGAISRNGQLGEFKKGFERTVTDVDGVIIPFYLRGLWGSRFSRASEGLQALRATALRRDVIVAFGQPLAIESSASAVKQQVTELSISAWEEHTRHLPTLAEAWIRSAKARPMQLALADIQGDTELSNRRALTASLLFARRIKRLNRGQNVGLLLPTSSAGVLANLGALLAGKTLVNLNYTASLAALKAACSKAELGTVFTARRFITKLEQRGIDLTPLGDQVSFVYLEDVAAEISPLEKALTLATTLLPASWLVRLTGGRQDSHSAAAILFSSGSEGEPKGVVLSHRNIMANIQQVSDVLDTLPEDRMMATLPLFHAFGLTVNGLMPMIEGIPAICHPDPTDALNIAKGIARYKGSIFCGTSTFLRLFNRNSKIHPLMLDSLRIVVAGAERLNPDVRDGFEKRFNKSILEGYGTTETTPVASVNVPDRIDTGDWHIQRGSKPGTVGLPLPGSSFRIVDPDTLATLPTGEDGLILIGGTQVMQGYLKDPERTAEVILELDGQRWYSSGDKGHLDDDGFLTIVDRYSRFAKLGGEMVSLGAVESAITKQLPEEVEVLATAIPDSRKGEKVVLLYSGDIDDDQLAAAIEQSTLNPLMRPAERIKVEGIPKLGSGKSDFKAARELALANSGG